MSDDAAHAGHHSEKHYIKIWGILVVLLVASVIGPFIGDAVRETGAATVATVITLITAFGIAFVKAWLVAKHFMHVNVERPIVWYSLITALVFMVLFFAGTAPDVMNHEGTNWTNMAAEAEVQRGLAEGSGHHGEGDHGDDHGGEHREPGGH